MLKPLAAGLEGGRGGQRLSPARPGADPDAGGHGDGKGRGGHGDGGEGTGWHGGTGGLRAPRPDAHPSIHPSLHPSTHPSSSLPLAQTTPGPPCAHPKGGGHPWDSPPGHPPGSPHHSLRLCSKAAQLFISSPAGVPRPPPPPPGAQAVRGPPEQLPSPFLGCKESQRRAPATILFPFNSACGSFELSSPSPRLRPGAELPGGCGGGLCFSLPSLLLPPCT